MSRRIRALLLLLLAACDRPAPRRGTDSAAQAARTFPHALTDSLWVAPLSDSAGRGAPSTLATDGDNLYVGDEEAQRILAMDSRSGRPRWTADSLRDSTLAGLTPGALSARRGGGVLVVDVVRGRLIALGADGRPRQQLNFDPARPIRSACELPDSTLLTTSDGPDRSAIALSSSWRPLRAHALPWPDVRRAPDLTTQLTLAPASDGCVVALTLGRGFARFVDDRFADTATYVERVPLPEVRSTRRETPDGMVVSVRLVDHSGAAEGLAVARERILIAFGGHSSDRDHVIDVYDLRGRYLESYRTATAVRAIAATDDAVFVLTRRDGLPVVVALRWPVAADNVRRVD